MSEEPISASWLERHITLHTHDSNREEIASGVVHGLGVVLSLAALVLLVQKGLRLNNPALLTGFVVYGLAMTLLYLSSTLYHFVPVSKTKRILRICDHMSIYILIAGTYTPVMLSLGGYYPMLTLGLVWLIAAGGMAFKIAFWGRLRFIQMLIYILMGWLIVLVWEPVVKQVSMEFFRMILAGGITYTSGTLVYAMKKMPYYHALWHLFVLAGSIWFFLAIYLYL
ncbi:MAG: PAQR family membrane homeostasis protein TrhA [bacterium]